MTGLKPVPSAAGWEIPRGGRGFGAFEYRSNGSSASLLCLKASSIRMDLCLEHSILRNSKITEHVIAISVSPIPASFLNVFGHVFRSERYLHLALQQLNTTHRG